MGRKAWAAAAVVIIAAGLFACFRVRSVAEIAGLRALWKVGAAEVVRESIGENGETRRARFSTGGAELAVFLEEMEARRCFGRKEPDAGQARYLLRFSDPSSQPQYSEWVLFLEDGTLYAEGQAYRLARGFAADAVTGKLEEILRENRGRVWEE